MSTTLERKTIKLDVKSIDEQGVFKGLLSAYDVIDGYGDVVDRGAFTKTLQEGGAKRPLLWQHKADFPIGDLTITDSHLGPEVEGRLLIHDDVPQARTAYALIKNGIIDGLSIGFKTIKADPKTAKPRHLKEIKLYEGSIVTFGANPLALISEVRSLDPYEKKDFNSELEAIDAWAKSYQMIQALSRAIDRIIYSDQPRDQKQSMLVEVLSQFNEAYQIYFPRLMDVMGTKNAPLFDIPSVVPAESVLVLSEITERLSAVMKHEAALEKRAAKTDREPGLHSIVASFKKFSLKE